MALAVSAQRSMEAVHPILTEEGQLVVFDRRSWQSRELAKRLTADQPWPAGAEFAKALAANGLDRDTPPATIPIPARIASGVYLVGQDRVSNLTYMIDCGPEGVAIIDPTYESEVERTVANVEKCGRSRKDIRWVLNTHCHVDHAMADFKFRELGARILIHEMDATHVERGTQVTGAYLVAAQTGRRDFPVSKVDHRLVDGEELRLGNKRMAVIHTPGHTPGSASFLMQADGKNLLFSGDTVLYDYRLGWQGNPYADNRAYAESLAKLSRFALDGTPVRFDLLLPGHGCMSMTKAYLDVQKAREQVQADVAAGRDIRAAPFSNPDYRTKMSGRPVSPYR